MKKTIYSIVCFFLCANFSYSQYCMLPGQTPYSALQPGITNFKLNTINRNSGNSESTSGVVVTTGLSTTLSAGQTYTISITHSEDAQFFQGDRNNLRVWIDYNANFSFTDPGETVLSVDLQAPATTYSATFTVPSTLTPGSYRLRATAKMSIDAGHTIPTPCNVPADPIGYHGEMEDYTIVLENSNPGQTPASGFLMSSTVCAKSALTLTNTSTGSPVPTYSWVSTPSAGVTFTPNNTSVNPKIVFNNAGSYTITCIATNSVASNSSNKSLAVSSCVGISENQLADEISVGPNPAYDVLYIRMPSEIKDLKLSIQNYVGQILLEEPVFNIDENGLVMLDLKTFADGLYLITIHTVQGNATKQIIISR